MSIEDGANCGEYRTTEEPLKGAISGAWFKGNKKKVFGRKDIQYSLIDGDPIFEGDIILDLIGDEEVDEDLLESVIIEGSQYRWTNGIVPYEIDTALPNKARVFNAIAHWEDHTIIRFIERTADNANDYQNYIRFRPSTGCSSYVGMRGGMQPIKLASGCGLGTTIHEIGHAVGLWHEQSREDRNNWITVHYDHISPGKVHNFNQHIADGEDIGPYDYASLMHYGPKAFSHDGHDTITPLHGGPIGQSNGLSAGDIASVWHMYHDLVEGHVIQQGIYTIQQKSTNRFVDAHTSGNDFSMVTRTEQNNDTQRWILTPVGGVYTIQQKSNDRFMDAHVVGPDDFSVVTRTEQNNDTQRWVLMHIGNSLGMYTIQQLVNGRFMDAYTSGNDFSAVTRRAQNNDTQRWVIMGLGGDTYTIQQKSNGRFVDAHLWSGPDFSVVTRPEQNNDTQRWTLTLVGGVYTIQQRSNDRFMDAHVVGGPDDFSAVTRTAQNNDTQRWVIMDLGGDTYTIQQLVNGRFVDAQEEQDFSVVTRRAQNNDTQRWLICNSER